MLRPNKKIGIIYGGQEGKNLANTFKSVIEEKRKGGYCIDWICVDGDNTSPYETIDKRVFTELDKCEFFAVFFTKDIAARYQGEDIFISKPNVLFEFGYAMRHAKKDQVICFITFRHEEIEKQLYFMPSDVVNKMTHVIDLNKNTYEQLSDHFCRFAQGKGVGRKNEFIPVENESIILTNSSYEIDFQHLFSEKEVSELNKQDLHEQLQGIINLWIKEKDQLNNNYLQLIYIFERLVFIPIFSDSIYRQDVQRFLELSTKNTAENTNCFFALLKWVVRYILSRNRENERESAKSYADYLKTEEILNDIGENVNPIIKKIVHNYIGLFYLNTAKANLVQNNFKLEDEISTLLMKAIEHFDAVLLNDILAQDTTNVIESFVYFNKARANELLGKPEAENDYCAAVDYRTMVSNSTHFPRTFLLYFQIESCYAELLYNQYMHDNNKIDQSLYTKTLKRISSRIQLLKETPISGISLFNSIDGLLKKILRD